MNTAVGAATSLPKAKRPKDRDLTKQELQYAILRIKNKGIKLTISEVAREAGVVPSLIHNTYPDIAEAIRAQIGKSTRKQRDATLAELAKARQVNKDLRGLLSKAETELAKLASINEMLRDEVTQLKAVASGKVVVLPRGKTL